MHPAGRFEWFDFVLLGWFATGWVEALSGRTAPSGEKNQFWV